MRFRNSDRETSSQSSEGSQCGRRYFLWLPASACLKHRCLCVSTITTYQTASADICIVISETVFCCFWLLYLFTTVAWPEVRLDLQACRLEKVALSECPSEKWRRVPLYRRNIRAHRSPEHRLSAFFIRRVLLHMNLSARQASLSASQVTQPRPPPPRAIHRFPEPRYLQHCIKLFYFPSKHTRGFCSHY
jgi:hypothetical protein